MSIDYTVLDGGRWMTHTAKRLAYEVQCDGCLLPLSNYSCTVITDRSGSEQAAVHSTTDCINKAVATLEEEE